MQDHLFLLNLYLQHNYIFYIIIVVLALLEGPFLSMVLGVFLKFGFLDLYLVYAAVMIGDLIGDTILYRLGYKYGDKAFVKIQKKFNVTEKQYERIKSLFHKRKYLVLFVSKITNGFGIAVLVLFTAGTAKIPFSKYITINFIAQFIWSGMLLFIGYTFADIFSKVNNVYDRILYIFSILVGILIIYFIQKYYKRNKI